MGYNLFLSPFLISLASAVVLLFFLSRKKITGNPRTSHRHIQDRNISRLGGIAVILSFVAALFLDKKLVIDAPLAGIIIVSIAILIFGILDDFKELSWKTQLVFQVLIVAFAYSMGAKLSYISNPFGGIIIFNGIKGYVIGLAIAIVWIVFIMNAINWLDGIDGVSGGISIICALTIFILSIKPEVNQPPIGIITAALIGGILAFLLFNFYPAKIIAGTSGAMFMGFILAILAIFAGAKIATTLLVLAIPIIDAWWVIFERLKNKKSVFMPDKRHLHFKLLNLGWSQRKICIFYYAVTLLIAIIALNTRAMGKIMTFVIFSFVLVSISFIIRSKLNNKEYRT